MLYSRIQVYYIYILDKYNNDNANKITASGYITFRGYFTHTYSII